MNRYIAGLVEVPTGVKNLADLIAFNAAHAAEELPQPFWTDQSTLVRLVGGPQMAITDIHHSSQIYRVGEYYSQPGVLRCTCRG